ncbi:MAG: hypothetical protein L3K23_08235 [Thermoplasmata archaeon]|nr:hypothetical protein [Thermoplasmata archaeon]
MTAGGPPFRQRRKAVGATILLASWALGALLIPAGAHAAPSPGGPAPSVSLGGACPGALDAKAYTGDLGLVGGPLSASAATNASVNVTYHYLLNYTPKVGPSSFTCRTGTTTTQTGTNGRFSLNASLPADSCSSTDCSYYTGPYGYLAFGTPPSPPPGYFLKVNQSNGQVSMTWVDALSAVTLVPGGRLTVSTGAPANVRAFPVAADGSRSPATLQFGWQLQGAGWSFSDTPGGSNVTVLAGSAPGPGTLELRLNGSWDGAELSLAPVSLGLTAVATSIDSAGLSPTALDSGWPATVVLNGSGSGGYLYTATLTPGPGTGSVPLTCTTNSTPGGTVAVLCHGIVIFTAPGTAQPTATLLNGYSAAQWHFPSVAIAAPLGPTVDPDPVGAYTGSRVTYHVGVATGTGTAPFSPVCLVVGDGRVACDRSPGTAWTFVLAAPPKGVWLGDASVRDAGGANVSAPVTTTVVDRPSLSDLITTTNDVTAGDRVAVRAVLAGGLFPATYWWNLSSPSSTVASGTVSADGLLAVNVTPLLAGTVVLTLTVRDGLGTTVANATTFVVAPGPATRLVAEAIAGNATWAGTPVAITLAADNVLGDRVPRFAVAVNVTVAGPSGAEGAGLGVNASGGTEFPLGNGGLLALPASAWRLGELNLTFTATVAGRWVVVFTTGIGPSGSSTTGGLVVEVSPDLGHLALTEPRVAVSGARTNATLYTIGDRFGNALDSGYVFVRTQFGGQLATHKSSVLVADGGSTVWVNYTAPGGVGGTVVVESALGSALLPTIYVPSGASPPLTPLALAGIAGLGAILGGTGVASLLLRRRRPRTEDAEALVPEHELERLAVGRARVLSALENGGALTLEELRGRLGSLQPTDGEVAEWVGSLVTEGSVTTHRGASGGTVFAVVPSSPGTPPRVELDPEALSRALAARETDATLE